MRTSKLHLMLGSALVLPFLIPATANAQVVPYAEASAAKQQEGADNQAPGEALATRTADGAVETGPGDAEIIVTGTRTGPQKLQRTPLAVSVVSSDLLEQQGLNTVQDIASYVPNLSFSRNTSAAIIRVRGIGSTNAGAGSDPSVTVQVDGVYIARATGQLTDFFDVDRIEVLRGPQGTLYGRNAIGGTINVIRPGLGQFLVQDVRLGKLDVPSPLVPRLVAEIRRGTIPAGVAQNGFPMAFPEYISDVRISTVFVPASVPRVSLVLA